MKRTIAILLVLVALCSAVFASGSKEAAPAATTSSAGSINAEEYKGADYVDPVKGWAKYDALIAAIKSETDTAKRTQMMHEAEDILMSNWCVIPIYYYNDHRHRSAFSRKAFPSGRGCRFQGVRIIHVREGRKPRKQRSGEGDSGRHEDLQGERIGNRCFPVRSSHA